jgi:hypothetical protein
MLPDRTCRSNTSTGMLDWGLRTSPGVDEAGATVGNGGSTMSFDALTISGLLVAIVSGGFLMGVVRNNDKRSDSADADAQHDHAGSLRERG